MLENWQEAGFGIYLHWPFCAAKCPYCDFNSHVAQSVDHVSWERAFLDELKRAADETPGRVVSTIFFGGGTPSLMEPRVVESILRCIERHWVVANDLEVTLEANPGSVDAGRFADLAGAGVNRLSLGVQALNDTDLKRLGRLHSVRDALESIDLAQSRFERVSFDLMYGRQYQSLDDWETELKQALTWGVSHLSLYHLTIEPGTAFGHRQRQGLLKGLPDEDLSARMYERTQELCADAGLPSYEVSNHSAPGMEARHNLIYWRGGDYVGVGPGAHGRLTDTDGRRFATEQTKMPKAWLEGPREILRCPLSGSDAAEELLMMSLRLGEGVDLDRFRARGGSGPFHVEELVDEGWIAVQDNRIVVRPKGMVVLNAIIERLLDGRT